MQQQSSDREAWRKADTERRERLRQQRADERAERRAAWHRDHAADLEARRQEKAAERAQQRADWFAEHAEDYLTGEARHAAEMAEKLGITVDEFRALQEQRRAEMAGKSPISYAADHEVK